MMHHVTTKKSTIQKESDGRVEIYLQKLLPLKVGVKVFKVFIFCSLEIV